MSSTSKDAVTLRAKRSKKPSDGKMRRNVEIFVLSAPAILLFVCFVILPIVLGAYYGFYQWKGYGLPSKTGKFVGLQNYITALKDPAFQAAILHTFEVVIGSLVIQAPLAILFALLLNQKFKGRGLIRTLIFVPYVVSEVIVGTGWSLLLQKKGAINEILANRHQWSRLAGRPENRYLDAAVADQLEIRRFRRNSDARRHAIHSRGTV